MSLAIVLVCVLDFEIKHIARAVKIGALDNFAGHY
jgi:hypothetical protein